MRKWYKEWKQKREVKIGTIDITEHTVGLATEYDQNRISSTDLMTIVTTT